MLRLSLLLFILILASLAFAADDKPIPPRFDISMKNAADIMETTLTDSTATFTISSQTGIGAATIKLAEGAWPKTLVFHLRYQGDRSGFEALEGFTLSTARLRAEGSLKESGKVPFRFKDAKGQIEKDTPTAGTLDIAMTETEPFLEITLPANLPLGSKELQVEWIDVYR